MKIVVMGVSGSGKSTIGKLLAEALTIPFFDGDDFHPDSNVQKMAAGLPLNDQDRKPWLERLALLLNNEEELVLACSALKASYRHILKGTNSLTWVYLEGTMEQIQERLDARKDHFMPRELLESQLNTLQVPEEAIRVGISDSPGGIVISILNQIKK